MDETTSREKVLKKVRNAVISKNENPYSTIDIDSSVYKEMEDTPDITFAQEFTKNIWCESEIINIEKPKVWKKVSQNLQLKGENHYKQHQSANSTNRSDCALAIAMAVNWGLSRSHHSRAGQSRATVGSPSQQHRWPSQDDGSTCLAKVRTSRRQGWSRCWRDDPLAAGLTTRQ